MVSARLAPSGATSRSWKQIERGAELLDELEGHVGAVDGVVDRIGRALPRPQHGSRPERIAARAPHRMPIGHAEAEVVAHRLALDQFALVVMAEGQRISESGPSYLILAMLGKAGMDGLLGVTWVSGQWLVSNKNARRLRSAGVRDGEADTG